MWFVFFKQKTAYEMRISDWSSDVCSSDLQVAQAAMQDAEAVPGGASTEIAALHEQGAPPHPGGFESDRTAVNAASDDDQIVRSCGSGLYVPVNHPWRTVRNSGFGCPEPTDRKSTRLNSSH